MSPVLALAASSTANGSPVAHTAAKNGGTITGVAGPVATVAAPVRSAAHRSRPLSSLAPAQPTTATRAATVGTGILDGFAGLHNTAGVVPAQPDIAVGPSDVVEIAQPDLQVFSTSGTPLTAPAPEDSLWSGDTGPCASRNSGDWSQVLYDQLANRFVYFRNVHTQSGGVPVSTECVAVSSTADPTGSWYWYDVVVASGTNAQTDYPQLGFSPNAYWVGTNLWNGGGGSGTFEGDLLLAFNRSDILSGSTLQVARTTLPSSYESFTPSTLEGPTTEPSGQPEVFAGGPSDFHTTGNTIDLFGAVPDWGSSKISIEGQRSMTVGSYDLDTCPSVPNCAPQPGTTTRLQAWSDNLMLPLVYRNFGSYQDYVGTFDVRSPQGHPDPLWFEIREPETPGKGAELYQEGLLDPNGASRFEQSIGMDAAGDIALAYSVSSSSTYPSIAASWRTPADALGTLRTEQELVAGGGAQTSSSPGASGDPGRWGDASYLDLAPDGCTFWYANEYYPTAGSGWSTAISSFSVPGCATGS